MNSRRFTAVFRTLCVAAVLALAACKTTGPYLPPSGASTAKLLIRTSVPPGKGYVVYAHDDPHACSGLLRITSGGAADLSHSTALRTGPPTTLRYIGGDRTRICTLIFSFYPKAGRTYLLALKQDTAGCALRLLDATDADKPRPERIFGRKMVNETCTPIASRPDDEVSEGFRPGPGTGSGGKPSSSDQLNDFKDLLPQK